MDFGFGATFEVTNGMLARTYAAKASQALRAKEFFEDGFGASKYKRRVAAGLAYLFAQPEVDESSSLNVFLNVKAYDPVRLERVLSRMLKIDESGLVLGMLTKRSDEFDLQGFIAGSSEELDKRARYLGVDPEQYRANLSRIKGFVMELYVMLLLKENIKDGVFYHRYIFDCDGVQRDADVVVACRESDFYRGVESIRRQPGIEARVFGRN